MSQLSPADIRITEFIAAGFYEEGMKFQNIQDRRFNVAAQPPKDGKLEIVVFEATPGGKAITGASISHPAPLNAASVERYKETGRDMARRVARLT